MSTALGSAARGEPSPRDLDIGVLAEFGQDFDILGVITELIGSHRGADGDRPDAPP
ncbi:MAG: hypothetical protein J2P20_09825 [Pseudonocardia sp.]|nr:hypothetical protein [Pseudonocardia sp.]